MRRLSYNSRDWNHWPKVQPPKGLLMHIQDSSFGYTGSVNKVHKWTVGFWNGTSWRTVDDVQDIKMEGEALLFRPWDDVNSWHFLGDVKK